MSEYDLMVTQQQMLIDYQLELRKAAREVQLRQRQQQQIDNSHKQTPTTIVLNALPQSVNATYAGTVQLATYSDGYLNTTYTTQLSANSNSNYDLSSNDEETPQEGVQAQHHVNPKITIVRQLSDLTVAELKCECKRRNLPVGGAKPVLLTRLDSYAEEIVASKQTQASTVAISTSANDTTTTALQTTANEGDVNIIQRYLQQHIAPTTPGSNYAPSDASSGVGECLKNVCKPVISTGVVSDIGQASPTTMPETTQAFGSQQPSYTVATQAAYNSTVQPLAIVTSNSNVANTQTLLRPDNLPLITSNFALPQQIAHLNFSPQGLQSHEWTQQSDTARQLSLQERMLQHQQMKIQQLQEELRKYHMQLLHQQNVINAARAAQQNPQLLLQLEPTIGSGIEEQRRATANRWLSSIDIPQMERVQQQHVAQLRAQQQQLQTTLHTQSQLVTSHRRLLEQPENAQQQTDIQQSCRDVIRALSDNPKSALLLAHVLRKFSLANNSAQQQLPSILNNTQQQSAPLLRSQYPHDETQWQSHERKRQLTGALSAPLQQVNEEPPNKATRRNCSLSTTTLDDNAMAPVYEAVLARAQREVQPSSTAPTPDMSTTTERLFTPPPINDDGTGDELDQIMSTLDNIDDLNNTAEQLNDDTKHELVDWLDLIGDSSPPPFGSTSNPLLAQPTAFT